MGVLTKMQIQSDPRLAMRQEMLTLAGGYFGGGGRRGRPELANWNPGASDADGDISPDLVDLRSLSRDLSRRHPLAGGAISTNVAHTVGTGLALQPAPDAAALGLSEDEARAWADRALAEWRPWAESVFCDLTLTQNFYGLQSLVERSMLESGDIFVLTPMRRTPGSAYQLALQTIEADRVCNPGSGQDTARLVQGVALGSYGEPAGYHVARQHPGALRLQGKQTWDYYAAFGADGRRNVLHYFERRRPGQTRGVPYLAAVIAPLKQLGRFTDAELSAAVLSAAFAIFIKMDPDAFGDLFSDDQRTKVIDRGLTWNGQISGSGATLDNAGKAVNLLPGEEVMAPDLGRPNPQFDPFFLAVVKQIAVGLEMPYEVLLKCFNSSYSASRAALLDAWRLFRIRRDRLATYFCQPVYELWLAEAVSLRRLAAPGFFADPALRHAWSRAVWTGDGPGSIDPLKEIDAAVARIEAGISTIAAESLAFDGVDWETKLQQRKREHAARAAAGLEPAAGSTGPRAGGYPSDPTPPGGGSPPPTP